MQKRPSIFTYMYENLNKFWNDSVSSYGNSETTFI